MLLYVVTPVVLLMFAFVAAVLLGGGLAVDDFDD